MADNCPVAQSKGFAVQCGDRAIGTIAFGISDVTGGVGIDCDWECCQCKACLGRVNCLENGDLIVNRWGKLIASVYSPVGPSDVWFCFLWLVGRGSEPKHEHKYAR